jgi:hypothetical protein
MAKWVEHRGYGGCPVIGARYRQYEIKTRDGRTSFPKCPAERAVWTKHNDPEASCMDIISYRDLRGKAAKEGE